MIFDPLNAPCERVGRLAPVFGVRLVFGMRSMSVPNRTTESKMIVVGCCSHPTTLMTRGREKMESE